MENSWKTTFSLVNSFRLTIQKTVHFSSHSKSGESVSDLQALFGSIADAVDREQIETDGIVVAFERPRIYRILVEVHDFFGCALLHRVVSSQSRG